MSVRSVVYVVLSVPRYDELSGQEGHFNLVASSAVGSVAPDVCVRCCREIIGHFSLPFFPQLPYLEGEVGCSRGGRELARSGRKGGGVAVQGQPRAGPCFHLPS